MAHGDLAQAWTRPDTAHTCRGGWRADPFAQFSVVRTTRGTTALQLALAGRVHRSERRVATRASGVTAQQKGSGRCADKQTDRQTDIPFKRCGNSR